jgi:hypothetical protein
MQFHLFEPDLHAQIGGEARKFGSCRSAGKQCQRHGPLALLIEDFNRSTPAFKLSVVNREGRALAFGPPCDGRSADSPPRSSSDALFSVFNPRVEPQDITATGFTLI